MIVVKVESWPQGYEARATELSRIFVSNIAEVDDICTYFARAETVGARHLGIAPAYAEVRVEGHDRRKSVLELLHKVFAKLVEPKTTTH